jgi:hypothetical protein
MATLCSTGGARREAARATRIYARRGPAKAREAARALV